MLDWLSHFGSLVIEIASEFTTALASFKSSVDDDVDEPIFAIFAVTFGKNAFALLEEVQ